MNDALRSKWAAHYSKKFSIEYLENIGQLQPANSFEYLAKYQHYAYLEWIVATMKTAMQGRHKFVTMQRLIKHVLQN